MTEGFDREGLSEGLRAGGVGVWAWDLGAARVRCTPEVAALFGVAEDAFDASLPALAARVADAGDGARIEAAVRAALEPAAPNLDSTHAIRMPDGATRWLAARARVVRGASGEARGLTGVVVDVTAQKESEAGLRASEERYRLFTELASDYVYDSRIVGGDTAVPHVVAGSFERTTGYKPEEIGALGGWLAVIEPADRADILARLAEIRSGKPFVHEYRIRTREGEVRWLRDRATPMLDPDTGELVGFVGGVQDVTALKELQEQLLHASKMQALAQLSGSVAHDFNNVLTIVMATMGLIESELPAHSRARACVSEIHEALARASDLTRSLLTFGRHDVAVARVVDLRRELEITWPLLVRAAGDGVSVELEDHASGEARVLVDAGQLRLALLNLVLNARDAMDGHGVVRVVLRREVLTAATRDKPPELAPGEYARIDVVDTGVGIAPEHVARVFEPYFTTKPVGGGTGLGLSIVYGVAHKHGGAVSLRSALGAGTTLSIRLPLTDAPIAMPAEPTRRPSMGGRDWLLLVEDDPPLRRVVRRVLEEHQYRVAAYASAEEVLALDASERARFAVLVSDVRLGGMDGVALAKRLREERPELPVLMVSGYTDEARHREIEAMGFRFVAKPFTPSGLAMAVRELLDGA